MTNLRIIQITVVDSSTIQATFTEPLDKSINLANISVDANTPGIPSPSVLSIYI